MGLTPPWRLTEKKKKKKKNMGELIFHKQCIWYFKILAYMTPKIWEVTKARCKDGQMDGQSSLKQNVLPTMGHKNSWKYLWAHLGF